MTHEDKHFATQRSNLRQLLHNGLSLGATTALVSRYLVIFLRKGTLGRQQTRSFRVTSLKGYEKCSGSGQSQHALNISSHQNSLYAR